MDARVVVRRGQQISDLQAARAFFVIAVLMLGAACGLAVRRVVFSVRAVTATATVASVTKHSGRRGPAYCPVLTFTPERGEAPVQVQSNLCTSRVEQYEPGQRVEVLYEPADPQTAEPLGQPSPVWFLVPILAPMGMGFLFGAFAFWKRERRRHG
jgi:hypothetical protein